MYKLTQEDLDFLKTYKASDFERPSVTADILIFTVKDGKLYLMLIKRKNPPFKNLWAIPGGFVNINETVDEAAERELQEETGIEGGYLEQFAVFSNPKRDPRTRVISVGFIALVSFKELLNNMRAGDDAKDIELFNVTDYLNGHLEPIINLIHKPISFTDLAFDHAEIIKIGINYLKTKLNYGDDKIIFFNLLNDKSFTVSDLQKIHEAILGKDLVGSNFQRYFKNTYLKTGKAEVTGEQIKQYQRPAKVYRLRGLV